MKINRFRAFVAVSALAATTVLAGCAATPAPAVTSQEPACVIQPPTSSVPDTPSAPRGLRAI